MRRLTLICHGATLATRTAAFPAEEALETAAVTRAQAMAGKVQRADLRLASPALRARETALALGQSVQVDEGLADWDCGDWRGRSFAELHEREPEALAAWRHDPAAAPHGGETLHALLARVADWLGNMTEAPDRVLAITHSAVIRAAVVAVLEAPVEAFWRIDVAPLSVTELRGDGRRWTLRALGATPLADETD
ncbi:phosphoglycerate mutase [Azorhizobium oxalatiphilum]|uniref:Phosphoglycerate mutase n=1 Tax=Azorhizobium oxalatiphilum TaxID=980631 RepID=A0A917C8Z3_9HYPH|nr:histidine phosphatase family protein [Azorhizobium oxalatiphilum]GGF73476.1 phosphoglycerate mutase [Azorhizobium oxalatiphilum]